MKYWKSILGLGFVVAHATLDALDTGSSVAVDSIEKPYDSDEKAAIEASSETYGFQAEVSRLMDIIINSLYSQRNVFLRELMSNAADALEKARYMGVMNSTYLDTKPELLILVEPNPEEKTLTIMDTGIGMTKEDLIKNLGTVARSGTTSFLEALATGGDINLIGQFGVGFYSAFLVADKVTVTSKHNDDEHQYIWESMVGGSFTISKDPRGPTLGRGTKITLFLKEDATEFATADAVEALIKRFNQFVTFPIRVLAERPEVISTAEDADEKSGSVESDISSEEDDSEAGEKTDSEKNMTQTVFVKYWKDVELEKPLWLRPKSEITDTEYKEFYKRISKDHRDPLIYTHFSGEGEVEFKAILYVPGKRDIDFWAPFVASKQTSIRLYARRVLVSDTFDDIVPKWASFIQGVVDSDDLPLKVDRESVSQSLVYSSIKKKLIGKVFELLKRLAKEEADEQKAYESAIAEGNSVDVKVPQKKYTDLWKDYGPYFLIGCVDDGMNRQKLGRLLRFESTKTVVDEQISLDQYVARMPENQKSIFYIGKPSKEEALASPYMQIYQKKGIEVLTLTEPLHETCLSRLAKYENLPLVSIEKLDGKLKTTEEEKVREKQLVQAYKPLTNIWSKHLSDSVFSVRISSSLVDDPAAIRVKRHAQSGFGDRVLRSQTFSSAADYSSKSDRILEVNPNHKLIQQMLESAKNTPDDPMIKEIARQVFDAAMLASGFVLENPVTLSRQVFKWISREAGVTTDSFIEDFHVSSETEGDDSEESTEDLDEEDSAEDMSHLFDDFDPSSFQYTPGDSDDMPDDSNDDMPETSSVTNSPEVSLDHDEL